MIQLPEGERSAIRAEILKRHRSVYAFCKSLAGVMGKSVVVQLLAGKYPGNVARQADKLRALAKGFRPAPAGLPGPDKIYAALEETACARCGRKRRGKRCRACKDLWHIQAEAIIGLTGEVA